jgi:hypothetical protein
MKYNRDIYVEIFNWLISCESKAVVIISNTKELHFICNYIKDVIKIDMNLDYLPNNRFPICISLNYDRSFNEVCWAYLDNEYSMSKDDILNFYENHYINYQIKFFNIEDFYYKRYYVIEIEKDFDSILGDL